MWTLNNQPLSDYGITGATLTRRQQAAASFSFELAGQAALTAADTFSWESLWTLRKDGQPVLLGRVATTARSATGEDETQRIEIRDLWWDLERTPYLQDWDTVTQSGHQKIKHPRTLLAHGPQDQRPTTASLIHQVLAGTPVGASVSLPSLRPPPIEGQNQSIAEVLRAILRWHPAASAYISPGTSILAVHHAAVALDIPVGDAVSSIDIHPRPDLLVSNVLIHYEAEVPHFVLIPGEEEDDPQTFDSRTRFTVFTDSAGGSGAGRHSLVVSLPAPPLEIEPPDLAPPPQPHLQPIKTRKLPRDGETGDDAEKFWLDMLGLTPLGIKRDDIVLPSEASGDGSIQPHKVKFAWEKDDEDSPDPNEHTPSAINPESTPLSRPPSADRFPRILVSGAIAEWMRVETSELHVSCTVGLRKSAIDELDAHDKKKIQHLSLRSATISGHPAYLVEAEVRVIGTTAKTKVYRHWPATFSGDLGTDQSQAWTRVRDETRIPGLASRILADRSHLPWEGSVLLQAEESPGPHLGRRLNLTGGRPEWATMAALVVAETLDIDAGTTRLEIGPPNHLEPQDYAALHAVARDAQRQRATAAHVPQPRQEEERSTHPGYGGVFPGIIQPKAELRTYGGGASYTPGFWASPGPSPNTVIVHPSVVSGLAQSNQVPVVGATPLTNSPPPAVSVSSSGTTVIALRVEAEPDEVNRGTAQEPDYRIVDGGGTMVGTVEVRTYATLAAMNQEQQIARVDNETGDTEQNMVVLIPLAIVTGGQSTSTSIVQAGHIGPIGVRMCEAGTAIVQSPALQVVAVDENGSIVAPPAP